MFYDQRLHLPKITANNRGTLFLFAIEERVIIDHIITNKIKIVPINSSSVDNTITCELAAGKYLVTKLALWEESKRAIGVSMITGALYPEVRARAQTMATANICCSPAES